MVMAFMSSEKKEEKKNAHLTLFKGFVIENSLSSPYIDPYLMGPCNSVHDTMHVCVCESMNINRYVINAYH